MDSKFFDIPFRSLSTDSDFLCKDGEAVISGEGASTAPVPGAVFAIVRDTLPGWHQSPDVYPSKTVPASEPGMEYWNYMAARLLEEFDAEAKLRNLFVAPFFVMAAWKTLSGEFLSPTEPVLMVPNSEPPLVATDGDATEKELILKIAGAVCSLYFKTDAPEALRDFIGEIETLQILVSTPLHTYERSEALLPGRHVSTDSRCISLDLATGVVDERRICTEILNMAWKMPAKGAGAGFEEAGNAYRSLKFYPYAEIPLEHIDRMNAFTSLKSGGNGIRIVNGAYPGIPYEKIAGINEGEIKSQPAIIEGRGKRIRILTRAIKLTKGAEYKRLRKARLYGNFNPQGITFSVEGSRDMKTWWKIAETKDSDVLGFPPAGFRFFRVEIEGVLPKGNDLQGVTFEIFN